MDTPAHYPWARRLVGAAKNSQACREACRSQNGRLYSSVEAIYGHESGLTRPHVTDTRISRSGRKLSHRSRHRPVRRSEERRKLNGGPVPESVRLTGRVTNAQKPLRAAGKQVGEQTNRLTCA